MTPGLSNSQAPAFVDFLWAPMRFLGAETSPVSLSLSLHLLTSSDVQHTRRQCDHIRWPPEKQRIPSAGGLRMTASEDLSAFLASWAWMLAGHAR